MILKTNSKQFVYSLSALLLLHYVSTSTALASYSVQTVQDPSGSNFIQLLGINNSDVIAGFDNSADNQAFVLNLPNNFSNRNMPGSLQSQATGINSADALSGIYVDAAGASHGFFRAANGVYTTIDQPGTAFNQALGINDSNTTVGYSSTDAGGQILQKANSQTGQVYSNIDALLPGNQNSQATGINNANHIVGFYQSTASTAIGFLDVGNTISTIDPFSSNFTQALGINNLGEIVGFYQDGLGIQHGYVDIGGTFSTFDPTGSHNTTINGVNDQGQIVGFYTDNNGNVVGFVGTPNNLPEPGSIALLVAGFFSLACSWQRRGFKSLLLTDHCRLLL